MLENHKNLTKGKKERIKLENLKNSTKGKKGRMTTKSIAKEIKRL